jgi:hypothetical protein
MTQPLAQAEAGSLLQKHSLPLTQVIAAGWTRWRKLVTDDAELGAILSNRTRASIVYDCIRHEALRAFVGIETVTVTEDRGFLLLTFSERIILRFKKFRGTTLRTSSAPTRQAQEYANQVLPGMEALTHLVAGYLPDEVGIDLKKAAITCPKGSGNEWIIELDMSRVLGGQTEEGTTAMVTPVATPDTTIGTIVRPRLADQEETSTDQQVSKER